MTQDEAKLIFECLVTYLDCRRAEDLSTCGKGRNQSDLEEATQRAGVSLLNALVGERKTL